MAEDFYASTFIPVTAYVDHGLKVYEAGNQKVYQDEDLVNVNEFFYHMIMN